MQKRILDNGLSVLYDKKPGNAVVVQVMVNVGSNDESADERGLSHFLEHILFEGTVLRPTNEKISNEIESLGGEFNAYTSNERTNYYVKVVKKHFHKAVAVLADILQNPVFKETNIEREKKVVLREIDMVDDEPRYQQWLEFHKALFTKNPAKFPTHGEKRVITSLSRDKIKAYFAKWYTLSNMTLVIVGDVKGWEKIVKKEFVKIKEKQPTRKRIKEPLKKSAKTIRIKTKNTNTYLIIGFNTVAQPNKDAYALEVINGILGRGQSGKMFIEMRSKRGLAYDVGTEHVAERSFGYFAIYASIDKKNVALSKKVILEELEKLQQIDERSVFESKRYLEGEYLLNVEDAQKRADQVLFWEQVGGAKLMEEYVKNIKRVTLKDVQRAAKKYFKNPLMVVLEGK